MFILNFAKHFLILLVVALYANCALSIKIYPRPCNSDKTIQIFTYNPTGMHMFTGFYGVQASLVFEPGEEIVTFVMSDSSPWEFSFNGNRVFLKATDEPADTNATIITNKNRVYHFTFNAIKLNVPIEDAPVEFRFHYGDISNSSNNISPIDNGGSDTYDSIPDITEIRGINAEYTVAGLHEQVKPVMAFDNGIFTYLKFKGSILPAVFSVDENGYEGVINFRVVEREFILVEGVFSALSVRHGSKVACVYNEDMPMPKIVRTQRSRGIFRPDP